MHLMPFDVVRPHRLEGAGTHMQGDERMAYSARLERGKSVGVEMQPRRGRSHGAEDARIHGLIALAIVAFRLPRDVGRQGYFAVSLEESRHLAREPQMEQIALSSEHARRMTSGQFDRGARLQALAGAQLHQRGVRRQGTFEQNFDASAAFLEAECTRRNHARIVENQQIRRAQQGWEVAKLKVAPRSGGAIERQHPAGGARRRGPLSNEFLGKIEVKVRAPHVLTILPRAAIAPRIKYTAPPGMLGWRNW